MYYWFILRPSNKQSIGETNMNLTCEGLPPRQSEAIVLAAQGMSEKMSDRAMKCSVDNVKNLRRAVYYKWRTPNVAATVAEGFKRGHLKYIPILFICLTSLFGMSQEMRPVRRPARTVSVVRVISTRPAA